MTAVGEPSKLDGKAAEIVGELTNASARACTPITLGVMNIKFKVETVEGAQFVVRFYPPVNAGAVDYEPDLVRRLYAAGLPVARVVGDSRSGPPSHLRYMVYEFIPGTPLSVSRDSLTPSALRRLAGQLADFLLALQRLTVHGHGDLITATVARFPSWSGFMKASFQEGIDAAERHGSLPLNLIRGMRIVRDSVDGIEPPVQWGLGWGDILPTNVLTEPDGSLAGLVDFEGALAAEGALNLGYCQALNGDLFLALTNAWSSVAGPEDKDRVDLYSALRGARISRFAHLPLPGGGHRTRVDQFLPGFAEATLRLASRLQTHART